MGEYASGVRCDVCCGRPLVCDVCGERAAVEEISEPVGRPTRVCAECRDSMCDASRLASAYGFARAS